MPLNVRLKKEYMERYGQYDNDYSRPQLNDEERLKNYFSLAHTYLTTIQSQINKQNADYQALIVPKLLDYHLVDDYIASIEQNVEIEAFDYELESDLFNAKKVLNNYEFFKSQYLYCET